MKKIILIALATLTLVITGLIVFIYTSWDKNYDVPFPDISSSTDSTTIARGKYLAFGPAHCATCHVPMNKIMEVENGLEIPLSGGWELEILPGSFRAPNLTPDMETGIGKLSDGQIARAMRYLVRHDSKFLMPLMTFQEMSDEDVTAIISFLRSQEAVRNEIKAAEYSFMGKALSAFGLVKPEGPKYTPPKSVAIDTTIEYGFYIANSVANCVGCHTERNLKTGKYIGPAFAGGYKFGPDSFTKNYVFISPNITPDQETGVMTKWDEETFINRFRIGRVYERSPMPWGAFSRMNEVELKAVYRYIQSLDPINRKIEKTVFAPEEKFTE